MKALSNSELNEKVLKGASFKEINFDTEIVAIMKPRFMKPYEIHCIGVMLEERESGKSSVTIKYLRGIERGLMNYMHFSAKDKKKIQEEIFKCI